ncbi:hypothetical protein EXIGLDRAFT_721257, partial [Exidia glandulosa HHB12029]
MFVRWWWLRAALWLRALAAWRKGGPGGTRSDPGSSLSSSTALGSCARGSTICTLLVLAEHLAEGSRLAGDGLVPSLLPRVNAMGVSSSTTQR